MKIRMDNQIMLGRIEDVCPSDTNYDFYTVFVSMMLIGWPSMGIAGSIAVAAEHTLDEAGTDTVEILGGIVIMSSTAYPFTSNTSGTDFIFTPYKARPASCSAWPRAAMMRSMVEPVRVTTLQTIGRGRKPPAEHQSLLTQSR